jgi:hypothetical protein
VKKVHALVHDGIVQFQRHHDGISPRCLVAERHALVVASLEGRLKLDKIPVRVVEEVERVSLAKPGEGHSLALVLTELPGARFGAAVVEYAGS